MQIALPDTERTAHRAYALRETRGFRRRADRPFTRVAYSAAHVVADPLAADRPRGSTRPSTGTRRSPTARHLWSLGLGVAEAMDTAQRGMGLDWPTSLELIRRSLDAARDVPRALVVACGAGTDHLAPGKARTRRRRHRAPTRSRSRRSRRWAAASS